MHSWTQQLFDCDAARDAALAALAAELEASLCALPCQPGEVDAREVSWVVELGFTPHLLFFLLCQQHYFRLSSVPAAFCSSLYNPQYPKSPTIYNIQYTIHNIQYNNNNNNNILLMRRDLPAGRQRITRSSPKSCGMPAPVGITASRLQHLYLLSSPKPRQQTSGCMRRFSG